jgi:Phage integrase family
MMWSRAPVLAMRASMPAWITGHLASTQHTQRRATGAMDDQDGSANSCRAGERSSVPDMIGCRRRPASSGRLLRRNFHRLWTNALQDVGLAGAGIHFHDLRHTGNTIAAASGASTKELMVRMGHSTMRAALIYQHATRERDKEIAAAMSARVRKERRKKVTKKVAKAAGTASEQQLDTGAEGHARGTTENAGA